MKAHPNTHPISHDVTLDVLSHSGDEGCLDAVLSYDPSDPLAMSMTFLTTPPVTWVFARDLLLQGMYEPVGHGDVQVWPGVTAAGAATVLIELTSPDGQVTTQMDLRQCHAFADQMTAAVPVGSEGVDVDLDAVLKQLLGDLPDLSV